MIKLLKMFIDFLRRNWVWDCDQNVHEESEISKHMRERRTNPNYSFEPNNVYHRDYKRMFSNTGDQ